MTKPVHAPEPRRHHYVPRFLLSRFAKKRKKGKFQTHVFDKHGGRAFLTAIENIMVEGDFNTARVGDVEFTLEQGLGAVENRAEEVIRKVVESRDLGTIGAEDRGVLATFATLQLLRTNAFRKMHLDIVTATRERLLRYADVDRSTRHTSVSQMAIRSKHSLCALWLPTLMNMRDAY